MAGEAVQAAAGRPCKWLHGAAVCAAPETNGGDGRARGESSVSPHVGPHASPLGGRLQELDGVSGMTELREEEEEEEEAVAVEEKEAEADLT